MSGPDAAGGISSGKSRDDATLISSSYPLDGLWEAHYTYGLTVQIEVRNHTFSVFPFKYSITLDQNGCPKFDWPLKGGAVVQSSKQHANVDVGETLVWSTMPPYPGHEMIVWKRLSH